MSRGLGRVQRDILDELAAAPVDCGVAVGDGGWSYRRAAHTLERRGLVRLVVQLDLGRRRLIAFRLRE